MSQYQQKTHSLWQEDSRIYFHPLASDKTTDVCIIGAGISGLTIAYNLLQQGLQVLVIEKESIGQNETGFSTAHISNALDDRYALLEKWHGVEGGRLAYESHTEAIDHIERIIAKEKLDCDYTRAEGYLFLGQGHDESLLQEEMRAAREAGFKDVEFLARAPVSFFESGPCLRFPRQAQFNPFKYLKGLALAVRSWGGEIFTQTHAVSIHGGVPGQVKSDGGFTISSQHIVVATNVPINDLVTMHTKEAAYRTYAIGLPIPAAHVVPSLFWDTSDPYHFVREHYMPNKNYDVLIVGGEDHRVGQCEHPEKQYAKLLEWTQLRLGINSEVLYKWSGQIIEPIDGLAYIGRNPGDYENVYIVSGDSGHGITHGTIAGMIIPDLIAGQGNKYEALYDPARFNWKCLGNYTRENIQGGKQYKDWLTHNREIPKREDLGINEGAIITEGLHKIAVYRDEDGDFHEFSAACPHLKGVLKWNSLEQTWDCPVHGSRFNRAGEVLNGPALSGLTPKDHLEIETKIPTSEAPEKRSPYEESPPP